MIKPWLVGVLAMLWLAGAQAAPDEGSGFGYRAQDWRQLREDVDASAQRPGGDIEARRRALIARARARFAAADTDGSGGLSRAEFSRFRPALARFFDQIDANHDGRVTEQELIEAWQNRRQLRGQARGQ